MAALDLTDPLNEEIWKDSPAVGAALARTYSIRDGGIGGQQELDPAGPLPWVPDLIGSTWRTDGELLVVGSAVSPFYCPGCSRRAAMPRELIASSPDASTFLTRFMEHVVVPDPDYYGKIATLLSAYAPPSRIALTDLCRAAFGRRQPDGTIRGGDRVADTPEARPLYQAYVDAAARWTEMRIRQTPGRLIVTLGEYATAGTLGLLQRFGYEVRTSWDSTLGEHLRRMPLYSYYQARKGGDAAYVVVSVHHPSSWSPNAVADSRVAIDEALAARR